MWKNGLGMLFIALYEDDSLFIRDKDEITILEKEFVYSGFQVKPPGELKKYLSCNINKNNEEGSENLHQGHFIKNINKVYGEQVKCLTTYKMPGTPSVGLVRPNDKNEMVT